MPELRPDALTAPFAAPDPHAVTLIRATARATGSGFDEEIRVLLRARLRVVGISGALLLVSFLLAALGGNRTASSFASNPAVEVAFNGLLFLLCVTALAILWRKPDLGLPALRTIEVVYFGIFALGAGVTRYYALVELPGPSPDPKFARMAVERATAMSNLPWMIMIVYYGVLIPNTRRRGVAMVLALAAVPFAATVAAAVANPELRPYVGFILSVTAMGVFLAAVAAVFSASRVHALQRQAFEAEKRANELGQYTLQQKLGEGGMGEVWLAEHRLLKRPCAVKFIRPELAAHPATAARFEREVRAVTTLTHFNTVRVYDYGRSDDGSFYYVMEYLEGPTLDGLVKERGPLAPGRAVYLLRQLCGALAEAHARGMVHRDLKPGNILVASLGGQRDVAKLLDFGLVQDLSTADSDARLTQTGTVLGTPSYMCPEQAAGFRVDARGDLYSLGAVAFFMLTGRPPFECATTGAYLTAHLTAAPPAVTEVRADAPADLSAVVAKCLAKPPTDRFQSVAELDAALAACRCAGDWSSDRAAGWWAERPKPFAADAIPTATVVRPNTT